MKDILQKIKDKKELSDLPDSLVKETLRSYMYANNIQYIPRSNKDIKVIIKEIRAKLRELSGRYQSSRTSQSQRLNLIKENNIDDLLKLHSSTKERRDDYLMIVKVISRLKPESILDLGCGLNPIAFFHFAKNKEYEYHAIDIKNNDLELVRKYFKLHKIDGKVLCKDIRTMSSFPKSDITLIFKTLDIIDNKHHKVSKKILSNINSRIILASFSTRTLSGKPMKSPKRKWFEKLVMELKYNVNIVLNTKNEIFYLIERPSRHSKLKMQLQQE